MSSPYAAYSPASSIYPMTVVAKSSTPSSPDTDPKTGEPVEQGTGAGMSMTTKVIIFVVVIIVVVGGAALIWWFVYIEKPLDVDENEIFKDTWWYT